MLEDDEVIREFLIESNENLARLDNEIVELERRPKDIELLGSIFRTFHTIKGTCGFLEYSRLESVTHAAENLLSKLRAGELDADGKIISLILEVIDAVRSILSLIETTGTEGEVTYDELSDRLKKAALAPEIAPEVAPSPAPVAAATPPPAVRAEAPTPVAVDPTPSQPDSAPEAAEPVSAAAESAEHYSSVSDSAIRVDVVLLDKLMNLVGELVLARNQVLQYNTQIDDASLNSTSQRLNLITTELQEGVMKTRMQPIGVVWNKLPRVVRDIAYALGKQIRLEMDGTSTELDKTIIEAIKDPLTHLVRNCCDHGVEHPTVRVAAGKKPAGTIFLRAYHEGGHVNIEISDDGAGIDLSRLKQKALERGILRPEQVEQVSDREAMNLIFHPGFSTAEQVTKVSGRGVGMDVVRSNIEKIGGLVDVSSRVGLGTTVRLKIPLTLAIIPGLVVTSGGERFVIPQVNLLELIRLEGEAGGKQIERIHGTRVYRRREQLLPIAYLNEVLQLPTPADQEAVNIVVLQAEDRQFGLVVDGISDTQEIVVKPLSKQLKGLTAYAGATIMGDGRVVLILDVVGIGQRSGVLTGTAEQNRGESRQKQSAAESQLKRLVLFSAGSLDRLAVPLALVARLEEFHASSLENAGGHKVIQYRDTILPLVSLASILEPERMDDSYSRDPVQAIVFSDRDRSVGIVVDQILDIVEDPASIQHRGGRRGLLGSATVGGKVTDFLDLHAVLQAARIDWFEESQPVDSAATVLLADGSAFSRSILRSDLETAGYQVVEAGTEQEVLRTLEQRTVNVLIASIDLPPSGGQSLLHAVRSKPGLDTLPILALTPGDPADTYNADPGFEEYLRKFDSESMVRSVAKLAAALSALETAGSAPAGR
ncbi:chemotaxis protein CheW [uncultured Paludibaculum sp.]|uniref:hybrid sensor histidine kinase/response regulator n=1 Tax=uncultured Paludibaculum sp. TaxID=1765020 RepID=UPI002AAB8885|nr:chemotaxis protein CheW [uncultured Paludibaculum sp.]